MKKIFCMLLVVMLFIPVAYAETFDLSSLSYDELIELRARITEKIMASPEWKEIKVSMGQLVVGQDIPAGSYCVKLAPDSELCVFNVYDDEGELIFSEGLRASINRTTIGKVILKEGQIVEIDNSVLFCPPTALSF